MASFRAQKTNKDPLDFIRGEKSNQPDMIEIIQKAYRHENLLDGQRILDRFKWDYLTELSIGHYFDFDFLLCYALKLKILDQYRMYKTAKGSEVYERLKEVHMPLIGESLQ